MSPIPAQRLGCPAAPVRSGWGSNVPAVTLPRNLSALFAQLAGTRPGHGSVSPSCRHPCAGRAPHRQHGGHRLQQALSDQRHLQLQVSPGTLRQPDGRARRFCHLWEGTQQVSVTAELARAVYSTCRLCVPTAAAQPRDGAGVCEELPVQCKSNISCAGIRPRAKGKGNSNVPAASGRPGGWEGAARSAPSPAAGRHWWLLGAPCAGRRSRCLPPRAVPHGFSLCSWGPDDDGKTVDGPHQLGKVKRRRSPSSAAHRGCSLPSGARPFLPQQARRVLPWHSARLFASVAASGCCAL